MWCTFSVLEISVTFASVYLCLSFLESTLSSFKGAFWANGGNIKHIGAKLM